jgi:hypothetical protein
MPNLGVGQGKGWSEVSMPADPVTEFDRYREEILAALGGREPLRVLRGTLDEVRALTESASADRLARSPGPGEWSPWQVLHHLVDNDMVWGVRTRMIVTQQRPVLVGYDQEAWNERLHRLDPDPRETLGLWLALRRSNLRFWESLDGAEWARVGLHTERGEQSVREIVLLLAGHDLVHIDQFRRGLAAA